MPSVLIVDDEPNIRRMVGALLGAEGYDVRDAADGAAGVAALADGRALPSPNEAAAQDIRMAERAAAERAGNVRVP